MSSVIDCLLRDRNCSCRGSKAINIDPAWVISEIESAVDPMDEVLGIVVQQSAIGNPRAGGAAIRVMAAPHPPPERDSEQPANPSTGPRPG